MDIETIRKAILSDQYEISQHAERERRNDNLSIADLENAILTGEIIEQYPEDPRGSSFLVLGYAMDGRPVHIVVGILPQNWMRFITVYVPDPNKWESDWKTRKKRSESR